MRARRAVLAVPASETAKIVKAAASIADDIVVDLEDAVALDQKDAARTNLATIEARTRGTTSVRVNATDSPWFELDVRAAHANSAISSVVVPKIENPAQLAQVDALLDELASEATRATALTVQALIESAAGVVNVAQVARSSAHLDALILGYADLAASLGRAQSASWQYAQDAVIFAARANGVAAIDGPVLTVHDDDQLSHAADTARDLGFDGKWVIHPRQLGTVLAAFTPTAEALADARGVLEAMDAAARDGRGAVEWKGRMLDEALAVQARRTLAQGEGR